MVNEYFGTITTYINDNCQVCVAFASVIAYSSYITRSRSGSLQLKCFCFRLDNVWGVGGGVRPVKYLVKKIVMLLKEYLCCGDIKEATRCLIELEVPHFHHELVYEVSH